MPKLRIWQYGTFQSYNLTETTATSGAFSGNLSDLTINVAKDWSGYKITNFGEPTASSDVATKGYVDAAAFASSGAIFGATISTQTILPSTDNTYTLGSTSKTWANIYSQNGNFINYIYTNGITAYSSSTVSVSANLIPASNASYSLGTATRAYLNGYFGILYATTSVQTTTVNTDNIAATSSTSIPVSAALIPFSDASYAFGSTARGWSAGYFQQLFASTSVATQQLGTNNLDTYTSTHIQVTANLWPSSDFAYSLGQAGNAWGNVVANNVIAQTEVDTNKLSVYTGNTISVNGIMDLGNGRLRIASNAFPTSGVGVEFGYDTSVSTGVVIAYDRSGTGYKGLNFGSQTLQLLGANNTQGIIIDVTGNIRFTNYGAGLITSDGSGNLTSVPGSGVNFGAAVSTQSLIPSTDATYNLGSTSKTYLNIYSKFAFVSTELDAKSAYTDLLGSYTAGNVISTAASLIPNASSTYSLGSGAKQWLSIYGTDIEASIALHTNFLTTYSSTTLTVAANLDMTNTYNVKGMKTTVNDVRLSRTINTSAANTTGVYINTYGYPIEVMATVTGSAGDNVAMFFSSVTTSWISAGQTQLAGTVTTLTKIIPINWFYRVSQVTGSLSVNQWVETEIGG